MFGRTLDVSYAYVAEIAAEISKHLSAGRRVTVVAHSQGGIILSNVVGALLAGGAPAAVLARLEAYSFCSAADESPGAGRVFAEHFAAENDFVARVGALHFSGALAKLAGVDPPAGAAEWNGHMHVLPKAAPGQGHLMKEMILPVFVAGLFGRDSQLWRKYFNRQSPEYVPISRHLAELTYP
jgi:pimeloyl-ACP methyl ester carboxylesterase